MNTILMDASLKVEICKEERQAPRSTVYPQQILGDRHITTTLISLTVKLKSSLTSPRSGCYHDDYKPQHLLFHYWAPVSGCTGPFPRRTSSEEDGTESSPIWKLYTQNTCIPHRTSTGRGRLQISRGGYMLQFDNNLSSSSQWIRT